MSKAKEKDKTGQLPSVSSVKEFDPNISSMPLKRNKRAKTVKEKAAPVAPAVAPVVLGVGAAVKKGESAVIESSEDIPSEMARSSSSSSSSSSIGETLDKGEPLDCPCSGKSLSLKGEPSNVYWRIWAYHDTILL